MPGDLFNLYLHQNYVEFFSDIEDLVRASEYLSTADLLCSNWDVSIFLIIFFILKFMNTQE